MSKKGWDKMAQLSIAQHKHCMVCGKAMEGEGDFCSEQCEQTIASRKKAQRRSTWIMMIVIGIVMLLFWVLMPLMLTITPGR